ncbi:MAG: hypothetical protein ABSF97_01785 [Candidatus Sulfotelmatobacter sp.]
MRNANVEVNNLGLPKARSGNFATVYKFDCGGKKWAVRCFNRQAQDQQERYAAINAYLRQVALPYTVDFTYFSKGIRVGAQWYPIVKMEWADGLQLDKWVEKNLHNSAALTSFLRAFVSMLSALQKASIAHGDLQHGNILVIDSAPKLVDYDGMYVPALSGRLSSEVGQPNYQNPRRSAHDFGPYLDNFSGWVIVLSLLALIVDPKLWQTFKGGDDCLLFRKRDFEVPNQSALLKALDGEPNQDLHQLVALFRTVMACSSQSMPAIVGTFSLPPVPVLPVHTTGPSWIQDHIAPPIKPSTPQLTHNIDWLLDATEVTAPGVRFENPIAAVRILAYLSLVALIVAVQFVIPYSIPLTLIPICSLIGLNLLAWRSRYRGEPAVPRLNSVLRQRNELRERIRVMNSQIQKAESEREKITKQVSDRVAIIAKEEKQQRATEQKVINENDGKLQSAISPSLRARQQLDTKEVAELNSLQNGLGRAVQILSQSIAALVQAEANELTNLLTATQKAFMQNALQNASIQSAAISGIGAGYRTRLQSAGIVTAADVDHRIIRVKGIGSQKAASLQAWRRLVEADARNRMPHSVPWHEQNSIKAKYSHQKSTSEAELHRLQEDLTNQETAIRKKYDGLRVPIDTAVASERQKHQAEANRVAAEFIQKRAVLAAKNREAEQAGVRELAKCDVRQNEVRKEAFSLQWKMGKVDREVARFSHVSFVSYVRHVLLFS